MNATSLPLSALPYFPLEPSWIEQSEAFRHADARLGLGLVRLLLAAWRGSPAGSIPHSHGYVAQATGLPLDVVGRHFHVLTEGFVLLDDARLHHVQLAKLAARMSDRYGREIEDFALSSAMATQAPDVFSMTAVESARGTTKGKRTLPRGFGYRMHPELAAWAGANGFPEEVDRQWIMDRFLDYANAKNVAYKDWEAGFRNFATAELGYGRRPPSQSGQSARGAGARALPASRTEAARQHNQSLFGLESPASLPAPDRGIPPGFGQPRRPVADEVIDAAAPRRWG